MSKQRNAVVAPADTSISGVEELEDVLARISKGDTSVRFSAPDESDCLWSVKLLINQLAEHIQQTNEEAHEMAIGLSEHYDTLNHLASGNFAARAATNSVNEVVAQMGELINLQADTLTSSILCAQQAESDKQGQLHFISVMLDTIPSPIFYKDANCRYLGCNSAFEAYVGIPRDEIIGKTPDELWSQDLADGYRQQDQALLDTPGRQTYETKVRYSDGTLRDVIFNKAVFTGEDGAVAGLVGVILDITERKAAEDALLFQNILLATQQEASIDGLLVVDENARILSYNRRFVEIWDIPARLVEAGMDEPVLQWATSRAANPQQFLEKVLSLYAHPQESSRDEIPLADGRTLDRYTVPLLAADGHYCGRLWSFRDITEQKAAELAINNAYQQLFDIIEFLPDATFVIDMDKNVIAWNRAIEIMTGVGKKEMLGQGDYAYAIPFYGERRPILIDLVDTDRETVDKYTFVRREGVTLFAETVIPDLRRPGENCYLWGTATPLFDSNNMRIGTIESIRDITDHKLAQQKQLLLESQLQHNRMLEAFMVRLSHDLRTPLTPLFVLLPLIKRRVTDSELQGMLDICQKGANVVKKMVDRAQLLVSLSTMTTVDKFELTPLVVAVERALADNDDSVVHKQVTCQKDFDHALLVSAVPEQLNELIANLIANAVRFSPENGVIRITAERQADAVSVSVHDEGIGLDAKNLDRIFDEFFKVDESRHDLEAPGLGLSICKRIVSNHHGRIWAESPGIGKGTTITFTINETAADS